MNIFALPVLLAGFTSQAGIIVAVGAQNAFIIRQGVARSHVPQIIAVCIAADMLLISLGTQGMSSMVTGHPTALKVLTWLGAAVLLMYGIMAFIRVGHRVRSLLLTRRVSGSVAHAGIGGPGMPASDTPGGVGRMEQHQAESSSLKRAMLLCLGFTFLNPGVYLDTIVLLGGIAATYGEPLKWSFATGAMMCSVVWFLLLGLLSTSMSRLFNSAKAWMVLDTIIGITMVLLAVHLVVR